MEHLRRMTLEGDVGVFHLGAGQHHKIIVQRPAVKTARRGPFQTRPGSGLALVGPGDEHIIPFVLGSVHAAAQLDAPVGLVVGLRAHGEAAGAGAARARGVGAIIEGDRDAWVACATDHGSLADVEAFLRYLNVMHGWGCFVADVDGAENDDAASAVLAFQQEYNLTFEASIDEDSVCGTQTLGAVFDVVRDEWNRWSHKHDLAEDDVQRLEWVVSKGAVDSEARGPGGVDIWVLEAEAFEGGDVSAARVGGSRVTRWQHHEVPPEPWAWAAGPFTIVTDLPPGEVVPREEYRLWSSDGGFDTTLVIPDDAVVEGVQTLRFLGVPCDKEYSLSVSIHGAEPSVLFSDTPYNQLHKIPQEALDEQEGV